MFRFSGLCLVNLTYRPGLIEKPHLPETLPAETTAITGREVGRQAHDQGLAVGRPMLSSLFKLDAAPANIPYLGGRHQRIDAARGSKAGGVQHGDNLDVNDRVVGLIRRQIRKRKLRRELGTQGGGHVQHLVVRGGEATERPFPYLASAIRRCRWSA